MRESVKEARPLVCLVAWRNRQTLAGKSPRGAIYPQCRLDCQARIPVNLERLWRLFRDLRASFVAYAAYSSRLAYDGSSGSLAASFPMSGLLRSCRW